MNRIEDEEGLRVSDGCQVEVVPQISFPREAAWAGLEHAL